MFVDEVGCSTNAEKDKTQKERRICYKKDRPRQIFSSSDIH